MDEQRLVDEENVTRLRMLRIQLQEEGELEDWTEMTAPVLAMLSDVCDALGLSKGARAQVLGYHNVVLLDCPTTLGLTALGLTATAVDVV